MTCTSPHPRGPAGVPGTPMYTRPLEASVVLRKHGTAEEAGVLFEHFHIGRAT